MKILFLSNKKNENLPKYLKIINNYDSSDIINLEFEEVNERSFLNEKYDLILKDRYYSELENFLFHTKARVINFHPSYLPENMKSDSNLWSIINDTKKGSSIIEMKDNKWLEYIIICQIEIFLSNEDTLKTSFEKCTDQFETLFMNNWEKIRNNSYEKKISNINEGKIYYGDEKGSFIDSLENKYETNVNDIPKLWKAYHKS